MPGAIRLYFNSMGKFYLGGYEYSSTVNETMHFIKPAFVANHWQILCILPSLWRSSLDKPCGYRFSHLTGLPRLLTMRIPEYRGKIKNKVSAFHTVKLMRALSDFVLQCDFNFKVMR
jgi:hypothetical protein